MSIGWIYKDGEVIVIPSFTAVIQKDDGWYVSTCPELGVASQRKTSKEAYVFLSHSAKDEAVVRSTRSVRTGRS